MNIIQNHDELFFDVDSEPLLYLRDHAVKFWAWFDVHILVSYDGIRGQYIYSEELKKMLQGGKFDSFYIADAAIVTKSLETSNLVTRVPIIEHQARELNDTFTKLYSELIFKGMSRKGFHSPKDVLEEDISQIRGGSLDTYQTIKILERLEGKMEYFIDVINENLIPIMELVHNTSIEFLVLYNRLSRKLQEHECEILDKYGNKIGNFYPTHYGRTYRFRDSNAISEWEKIHMIE